MLQIIREVFWGLIWAIIILLTLWVHYTMCNDVPEFRYLGF